MFQLPNVEFEQTAFCIMKTFQGVLKKEEFGIYLLTYLHPRDTPAPPSNTHTGSTGALHNQMMMLIFDDQFMSG